MSLLSSSSFPPPCHVTCPCAHRPQRQAHGESGMLDRRTWESSRGGVSAAACLCFRAGADKRFPTGTPSPAPHARDTGRCSGCPAPADAQAPGPCCAFTWNSGIGGSLENCSMRDWIGIGHRAVVSYWRDVASTHQGLFPAVPCSKSASVVRRGAAFAVARGPGVTPTDLCDSLCLLPLLPTLLSLQFPHAAPKSPLSMVP